MVDSDQLGRKMTEECLWTNLSVYRLHLRKEVHKRVTRVAPGTLEVAERYHTFAEQRGAALGPLEQAAVDKVTLEFARRPEG